MIARIQPRHHDVASLDEPDGMTLLGIGQRIQGSRQPRAGGVDEDSCLHLGVPAVPAILQNDAPAFAAGGGGFEPRARENARAAVGDRRELGHQIRNRHPRLTAWADGKNRLHREETLFDTQSLHRTGQVRRYLFSMVPGDQRFLIKQVALRRTTRHEQKDHSFRAWRETW